MSISIEQVKELRNETGISVMECKKALEETNGDKEKALILLKKRSGEIAAKKSGRELGAGVVSAYTHTTGTVGAMITLSCETDFVSKNEEFVALAHDIAMQVTAMNPEFANADAIPTDEIEKVKETFAPEVEGKPEELKEQILKGKIDSYFSDRILATQSFVKNPDITIGAMLSEATQKFGERIEVTSMVRLEV
ncbi:elongation factor Ts [Candidatus Wolfebacteria bacterium]|nr:MAG: elongation factor Ts [Candidatus Wolfebacteria bacterium]